MPLSLLDSADLLGRSALRFLQRGAAALPLFGIDIAASARFAAQAVLDVFELPMHFLRIGLPDSLHDVLRFPAALFQPQEGEERGELLSGLRGAGANRAASHRGRADSAQLLAAFLPFQRPVFEHHDHGCVARLAEHGVVGHSASLEGGAGARRLDEGAAERLEYEL